MTPLPQYTMRMLRGWAVACVFAGLLLVLTAWLVLRPTQSGLEFVQQARRLHAMRQYALAEQAALEALKSDPRLGEASWIASRSAFEQRDVARALDHAQRAKDGSHQSKVRLALWRAELHDNHLHHFDAAEDAYREVLLLEPDNSEANVRLARLLGLCGRRREAVPYILKQVSQSNPGDQLVLLAREESAVNDRSGLDRAHANYPEDSNPKIGLAWLDADAGNFDSAIARLKSVNPQSPQYLSAFLALGQVLLKAERFAELADWLRQLPPDTQDGGAFFIRGRLAEQSGDTKGAIRCYWEATKLVPESKVYCVRLSRLLAQGGEAKAAETYTRHLNALQELATAQDRALFSNAEHSPTPLMVLTARYESLGRLWEAYGWILMVMKEHTGDINVYHRFSYLKTKVANLPLKQTVDSANPALTIDLSRYPLPKPPVVNQSTLAATDAPSSELTFQENARDIGLRFAYFNGTTGPPTRRMFEFTGGGIGVLDYDVDGWPDVMLTQGCHWPPGSPDSVHIDKLFRNGRGGQFGDVSTNAGLQEAGFGQGITVGDYNSDGFPDVYVANIGANVLWRNNGDGTFTDVTAEAAMSGEAWTTSCVMADLNGDALPDIYDVNYVMGADVYDRICQHQDGTPKICMPFDFDGQPDRLWLNDGQGRFVDATQQVLAEQPAGKGLGVAVWDPGLGRPSLFVANDTTPDFFFERDSASQQPLRMSDQALPAGLAFNAEGKATASMGVALADVNDDGLIDVHITNFAGEANSLFVSTSAGIYEERSREWGLHSSTLDLLGFGTQFLDVDLDGRPELFVANGHIDDWRAQGRPYEMPPLLFRRRGQRLEKVEPERLGTYFNQKWLGRSVARIDWNRDGREDLLVGHLASDSALLTNTTPTRNGFVSIRLIGVASSRDAIGTVVRGRLGKRTWTQQLTAGDGYQASNERRITIGTGDATQIDELEIQWPSGARQRFADITANQELWLIEGRPFLKVIR